MGVSRPSDCGGMSGTTRLAPKTQSVFQTHSDASLEASGCSGRLVAATGCSRGARKRPSSLFRPLLGCARALQVSQSGETHLGVWLNQLGALDRAAWNGRVLRSSESERTSYPL
jgi:hypothetical protein